MTHRIRIVFSPTDRVADSIAAEAEIDRARMDRALRRDVERDQYKWDSTHAVYRRPIRPR